MKGEGGRSEGRRREEQRDRGGGRNRGERQGGRRERALADCTPGSPS